MEFARRSRCRQTEVLAMTRPGEQIRVEVDDQGYMTVHLLSIPEPVPAMRPQEETPRQTGVALDSYDGSDPFAETDLPVKMDD